MAFGFKEQTKEMPLSATEELHKLSEEAVSGFEEETAKKELTHPEEYKKKVIGNLFADVNRANAGEQTTFGGGGGEYNPFADPFKVKEISAQKMEGEEAGRLKAQQGMFGKAFIPKAESGKEPAKDAMGGSIKTETPKLHADFHNFAEQKMDEMLENNPVGMDKKSGFNTGVNTNWMSGY